MKQFYIWPSHNAAVASVEKDKGGDPVSKKVTPIHSIRAMIAQQLPRIGLFDSFSSKDLLLIEAIANGPKAAVGPQLVHIDLTNRCNLNCIACWIHSPSVKKRSCDQKDDVHTLCFSSLVGVVDDLVQLKGTTRIKLTGGGEPTCHPRLRDIIAYIKKCDETIEVDLHTNFTIFRETVPLAFQDRLTVSLWAGTPAGYTATHLNTTGNLFREMMEKLSEICRRPFRDRPVVRIHNVIMKQNCHEFTAMLNAGLDIGVDEMHFVLVDIVPEKTEHLLINRKQRLTLLTSALRVKSRVDYLGQYHDKGNGRSIKLVNFDAFINQLREPNTETGCYSQHTVDFVPCYSGWAYVRIMADGSVVPCCKGYRMVMGNINKSRFQKIWRSAKYRIFRRNGLIFRKSHPYFSKMGNDPDRATGCYNCDNLMDNLVIHRKRLAATNYLKWLKFERMLLSNRIV